MNLYQELNIDLNKKEMICFVGAGGKTSSMFKLAKELKNLKKRVLVTTTTAIFFPKKDEIDLIIINNTDNIRNFFITSKDSITVMGKHLTEDNKLKGFDDKILDKLLEDSCFDYILVEGDGSRQKPIKAPAEYEPVIPSLSGCVIGLVGLDALGRPITSETVHRLEEFCKVTSKIEQEIIDENTIASLATHKKGIFKNASKEARKYLFLNKTEDENTKRSAHIIARTIYDKNKDITGIIAGSIMKDNLFCHWRGEN